MKMNSLAPATNECIYPILVPVSIFYWQPLLHFSITSSLPSHFPRMAFCGFQRGGNLREQGPGCMAGGAEQSIRVLFKKHVTLPRHFVDPCAIARKRITPRCCSSKRDIQKLTRENLQTFSVDFD
jgi:hypothetical protein